MTREEIIQQYKDKLAKAGAVHEASKVKNGDACGTWIMLERMGLLRDRDALLMKYGHLPK